MKQIAVIYSQIFTIFKHHSMICLSSIGTFILPIRSLLLLVAFVIVLDTLTGLYRSHKLGHAITSRKLSQIITKLILYNVAIISTYILDVFLLGEFVHIFTNLQFLFTKIVCLIFVMIEIVSVNENVSQAFNVNLFTEFKKLLVRTRYVKDELTDISKPKE